ncbi:MAG TPA: hypothetical protein VM867_04530, partial [Xanthobacteraceae bacterium]|nr:hypothetical protein [Xanthobacteraceae bacterium]
YRTKNSGHFTDAELNSFEGQSGMLTALTIRHCELVRFQAAIRPSRDSVGAQIEEWREPLSAREIEVCAAILCEGSVKQAVRAIGMQPATFITYRKRAFTKLRVSTSEQLRQLYEQRL